MDNIHILKMMKAELEQRVAALDSAISIMTQAQGTIPDMYAPDAYEDASAETQAPCFVGKAGNTTFASDYDFTAQRGVGLPEPDGPWTCPTCGAVNAAGKKVCSECKSKR